MKVTISAPADKVWSYAADPARLPRWWPAVDRVDRPDPESYTRWVMSPRGKAVPMAFSLSSLRAGESVEWIQVLAGTPFAKAIGSSTESISVAEADAGSEVTISINRRLKGTARLGSFFVRRGQKRELASAAAQLKEALDA